MANKTDNILLPAYLIVGEDELKRNTALKRLQSRLSASGDTSFNQDEFNGESSSGEDIVSSCNTLPFASPFRLVKLTNAEKLKKQDIDLLVDYLSAPLETTVLAISAVKLAKNTRLYKACASLGPKAIIDCAPKKRYEMPRIAKAIAKGNGVELTDDGALALLDLVGDNTVLLDNELKKLAISCSHLSVVSASEVKDLVARTSEVKPWQFVDAFAARNLSECLSLWECMNVRNVYSLIALCSERIRELIATQSLERRGEGTRLAQVLGVPEWRVKNHRLWAGKYAPGELEYALERALYAEYQMKSGSDPETAFIDWVVQTLSKKSE